ncbi:MAG: MurT ligase domain-containing protein [Clostridiales bacterium]|nr:MAG: MurT ligase domain-containing protein [Clostridiales bacterium]
MKFDINFGGKTLPVSVDYKGFYNIYNILAAFSAFASLNLGFDNIGKTLAEYKPQIGRMESFNIGGKKVILNFVKNPAGFNQAIATLNADTEEKDVFVVINDNAQDGRDISWIWDVDFELMAKSNIKSLTAGGIRRDDVAVRFKYADLKDFDVLENNIKILPK